MKFEKNLSSLFTNLTTIYFWVVLIVSTLLGIVIVGAYITGVPIVFDPWTANLFAFGFYLYVAENCWNNLKKLKKFRKEIKKKIF